MIVPPMTILKYTQEMVANGSKNARTTQKHMTTYKYYIQTEIME